MRDSQLAARLYGTPLMIHPEKAAIIEAVLRAHMRRQELPQSGAESRRPDVWAAHPKIEWKPRDSRPFAVTRSGIAVIPVLGTLVHRGMMFDAFSGIESYTNIDARLNAALEAGDVQAILFEWDTFGGEVFGVNELALKIAEASAIKPVWGCINEQCYSAGYYLAASCERILIPRSGETCNIGTIALHVDQSKFDEQMGFTYTYIYDGDHKKDWNPHEALEEGPRDRLQALVSRHGLMFRTHVAQMRGLDLDAVTATKADILSAEQAVDDGFADDIANFEETVSLMEEGLRSNTLRSTGARTAGRHLNSEKEPIMAQQKEPAAAGNADLKYTQAQMDQAVEAAKASAKAEGVAEGMAAGKKEGLETGKAEGKLEGVKAERDRVRKIMGHAEAKERQAAAFSCATATEMSEEQAGNFLATLPKQQQAAGFASLMAGVDNPKVGADAGAGGDGAKPAINRASIYESRAKAVLTSVK